MVEVLGVYVGTDTLAGMSAVLTYWFALASWIMLIFCWRHRFRFRHWGTIGDRERADASLNLGLLFVFGNATYQRALATYSFAAQEWKLTTATLFAAPVYLPATMLGMSLFLWWACFALFGDDRRWWWCLWQWTGLALFAAVVLIF